MWFNGPITEAIGKAKSSKVILVVFVRHATPNDLSDRMESFWTDEEIASQCQNAGVVALKLSESSESAQQFAQIYPVTVVPSSFLIGRNGVPLDIITMTDNVTRDAFSGKIRTAIQAHTASLTESSSPTTAQLPSTSTTAEVPRSPTAAAEPKRDMAMEEKKERAKQLLAEKRAADEQKAKAEEREKEIRRREEGRAMRDAQEQIRDRQLREAAIQRRNEKKENDAALQRLREQIAADRAEQEARRKRNAAATQGDDASSTPITPSESARPSTPPLQQQFVNQAARSEEARIQCRFVDGTRLVHTFLPDDLLQDVITLINQDGRESGDFHLVQMYPRREFSAQELNQSLRDLGLAPSAVLVVMPESGRLAPSGGRSGSSDTASGGGVMGVLTALFVAITSPLFNIYHLLLTFLGFGNPNTPAVRAATQSNNANRSPRPPAGNVHRFRPDDDAERKDDDDDDDMGTYNGNSTQQL